MHKYGATQINYCYYLWNGILQQGSVDSEGLKNERSEKWMNEWINEWMSTK